jgi:hypothetical protein
MQSVVGSRRSQVLRDMGEATMEHRLSATVFLTGPLRAGTTVGGQFGWGGTPLKRYQGRPKVGSGGTETLRRVQGQKPA